MIKIKPKYVQRTTEKAVGVLPEKGKFGDLIWLPKSQVKVDSNFIVEVEKFLINEYKQDLFPIPEEDSPKVEKIKVENLKVIKIKDELKALVTFSNGKVYRRKLYPRKTGKLKGNYLLNFRCNIFKFSKIDSNNVATDLSWIGNYEKGIKFEEVIKNIENEKEELPVEKEEKVEVDYSKPIKHKEFDTIKTCVQSDIPVYLVGPAGSGKNHTLQQIADELKLDFYFTNSIQQEFKITGFIDAGGKYHETEFYKAFTKGGLFFLDEMDASIPEVLVLLNAAIANRYFEFPIGRIEAHKDFRVVAAGNTIGNGADEQYTGRLVLDQATLDRFAVIEFDYDKNIEMALAKGNTQLVEFINELRDRCNELGVRGTFSYRCISNILKLESALPLDKVIKISIVKGMDKDTVNTLIIPIKSRTNKYWKAFNNQ